MKEVLKNQKIIRVYIASASGSGVEKAGIDIINDLRHHQDYQEKIEVVYLDSGRDDLAGLLGLSSNFTVDKPYRLDEKTTFIPLSYFEKYKFQFTVCRFAFSETTMGANSPSAIKAEAYIQIKHGINESSFKYEVCNQPEMQKQKTDSLSVLKAVLPTQKDAEKQLTSLAVDAEAYPKQKGLLYLIKNLDQYLMAAVYGLHETFQNLNRPQIVTNLIGTLDILHKKNINKAKKVILMLNDLPNHWADIRQQNKLLKTHYLTIEQPNFIQLFESIPDGETIVVNVGHIPAKVFDWFAIRSDVFVQEGKSSEILAATARKAPLYSGGRSGGHWPTVKKLLKSTNSSLSPELFDSVVQALLSEPSYNNAQVIAQYIWDSRDPSTEIGKFWHDFFEQYHAPENSVFLKSVNHTAPLIEHDRERRIKIDDYNALKKRVNGNDLSGFQKSIQRFSPWSRPSPEIPSIALYAYQQKKLDFLQAACTYHEGDDRAEFSCTWMNSPSVTHFTLRQSVELYFNKIEFSNLTLEGQIFLSAYFYDNQKAMDLLPRYVKQSADSNQLIPNVIRLTAHLAEIETNEDFFRQYFRSVYKLFFTAPAHLQENIVYNIHDVLESRRRNDLLQLLPQITNRSSFFSDNNFLQTIGQGIYHLLGAASGTTFFGAQKILASSVKNAEQEEYSLARQFSLNETPLWLFLGVMVSALAIAIGLLYFICNSCEHNKTVKLKPS